MAQDKGLWRHHWWELFLWVALGLTCGLAFGGCSEARVKSYLDFASQRTMKHAADEVDARLPGWTDSMLDAIEKKLKPPEEDHQDAALGLLIGGVGVAVLRSGLARKLLSRVRGNNGNS